MYEDSMYIVFKRDEWYDAVAAPNRHAIEDLEPVKDAVVIRRQDEIAPPVLDLYAGVYNVFAEMLRRHGEDAEAKHVQASADYFHQQAATAWQIKRKLPD